jgi:shikimate kinase
MQILPPDFKVLLIGGTSHTGKSTLATALAEQLGWHMRTTDTLARHPGRPWPTPTWSVPSHVSEHYATLSIEELFADVLQHYQTTIWPMAKAMIESYAQSDSKPGLVLEGSALWPEKVVTLNLDNVGALWLTAPHDLIVKRIYGESKYSQKTPSEKELIDKFAQRALLFDDRMMQAIARLRLAHVNIGTTDNLLQFTELSLQRFAPLRKI